MKESANNPSRSKLFQAGVLDLTIDMYGKNTKCERYIFNDWKNKW